MAFSDFPAQQHVVALLQRSLERGRLGHAYLFTGHQMEELEDMARVLAKALNCQQPPRRAANGFALDCCDSCLSCRKIQDGLHADVMWLRPESKTRVIKVSQIVPRQDSDGRSLSEMVYKTSIEGRYKVGIIVAADRMNKEASNAFLKTLEEPPPQCVFILLSTEPDRLLETILSRCLRLNFAGAAAARADAATIQWLQVWGELAANGNRSLLSRYRLLGVLSQRLAALREEVEEKLTAQSPLNKYTDAEPALKEKWEEELKAAIEGEYRGRRAELIAVLGWWLRDVWMQASGFSGQPLSFPQCATHTAAVARRLKPANALANLEVMEKLQRMLHTNVQEALALEAGLLRLKL